MLKIGSNYVVDADKYNFKLTYVTQREDKETSRFVGFYTSFDGVIKAIAKDSINRAIDDADETSDCVAVLNNVYASIFDTVQQAVEAVKEIKPDLLYVPTKGVRKQEQTQEGSDTNNKY